MGGDGTPRAPCGALLIHGTRASRCRIAKKIILVVRLGAVETGRPSYEPRRRVESVCAALHLGGI